MLGQDGALAIRERRLTDGLNARDESYGTSRPAYPPSSSCLLTKPRICSPVLMITRKFGSEIRGIPRAASIRYREP